MENDNNNKNKNVDSGVTGILSTLIFTAIAILVMIIMSKTMNG